MPPTSTSVDSRLKRYGASPTDINGRQSVISVRSFVAFEKDDDEDKEDGNIHEILRKRSSFGTSVAETVASPVTFKKIWAETAGLSLSSRQPSYLRRSDSIRSNPERNKTELFITAASGIPQSAETRSPSSPSKSLLSQSTKSRVESSSSSRTPRSNSALYGLQSNRLIDHDGLKPLTGEETDPSSFDLVSPCISPGIQYSLETRSEALFSRDHLEVIFDDPILLRRFMDFLYAFRPKSVPILVYYLDALKALKAINYANAVTSSLLPIRGLTFTEDAVSKTSNESLREKARKAFQSLVNEDLPAYITHIWIQTVGVTLKRRITNTLPEHLRGLSNGLAEVFCLTDPSRLNNPVIFATKEYHRMTHYGTDYVLGRNCRFLQGPYTNLSSVRRIREHLEAGKEHCETLLNYRRDGSPFMNLLMVAPLFDIRGVVRYHIGAQVDVSGLAKECANLESLSRLVSQKHGTSDQGNSEGAHSQHNEKDEFRELAEMFSFGELKTVRDAGGIMQHSRRGEVGDDEGSSSCHRSRLPGTNDASPGPHDSDPMLNISASSGSQFRSLYRHYLIVRPYPSLRVLFASPSLRFPGMLQSNFMSRIGGAQNVREELTEAFKDGRGITVKIRWVTKLDSYGKGRWIHCTPLFGANGAVGVWIVILVDDNEDDTAQQNRGAPPVDEHMGGRRPFDDDIVILSSSANAEKDLDEQLPPSTTRDASKG
ncbi:hypothetical protein F4804DRAFT_171401 [Jackrogersella minutella]|nr:hypothetical protein F4804DRAFT_171401 [Jackrogersella minutella]